MILRFFFVPAMGKLANNDEIIYKFSAKDKRRSCIRYSHHTIAIKMPCVHCTVCTQCIACDEFYVNRIKVWAQSNCIVCNVHDPRSRCRCPCPCPCPLTDVKSLSQQKQIDILAEMKMNKEKKRIQIMNGNGKGKNVELPYILSAMIKILNDMHLLFVIHHHLHHSPNRCSMDAAWIYVYMWPAFNVSNTHIKRIYVE